MALSSTTTQAGTTFSVAVVFARQEFESWLIAGVPSLAAKYHDEVGDDFQNVETAPRDAKKWIGKRSKGGYKPTQHQAPLASELDIDVAIERLRSFRRLDNAIQEFIDAARSGQHTVSPCVRS